MSLLTICQTALAESRMAGTIGTTAAASGFNQAVINHAIEADVFIQAQHPDWRFLWKVWDTTLSAGATSGLFAEYDPPSDVRTFIPNAALLNGNPLRIYNYETNRSLALLTTSGTPTSMVLMPNGKVRFTPIPTATATLSAEYFRMPLRMALDNDLSLIPVGFERAIVTLTLAKIHEGNNAWENYNQAMLEHETWMSQLRSSQLPGYDNVTMGSGGPRLGVVR